MKALTLTQPWATLIAIGAKRIETRSWSTKYRGPLAIHAAKGFPKWAKEFAHEPPVSVLFGMRHEYPRGCVIATCRLVDVLSTDKIHYRTGEASWRSPYRFLSVQEQRFGDYSAGRFAWILEDVQPLPEPIPAKGSLGLWEWENSFAMLRNVR